MPQGLAASARWVDDVPERPHILKPVNGTRGRSRDDLNSLGNYSALPFEIFANITEGCLDLESAMAPARTSFALREWVSSLPMVERIQDSQHLALPFILLQQTQTAKFHTLRDFKASLQAFVCNVCRIESQFAALVNLLTLQRVCDQCVVVDNLCLPIPTNLAEDLFGLDEATMQSYGLILARVMSKHAKRRHSQHPIMKRACDTWHTNQNAFNLQDVIEGAVRIFSEPGRPGVLGLKDHMEKFLVPHTGPGPRVLLPPEASLGVHLTDTISVANVMRPVHESWQGFADDARYAVVAPMPHLSLPDSLEFGLRCDGCCSKTRHRNGWKTSHIYDTAFLHRQLLDHVENCDSAQMVLRGERLRCDEEWAEASILQNQMNRIWSPNAGLSVPVHIPVAIHDLELGTERTPEEFRSSQRPNQQYNRAGKDGARHRVAVEG